MTNRDLALMNAMKIVFPECTKLVKKNAWEYVIDVWGSLGSHDPYELYGPTTIHQPAAAINEGGKTYLDGRSGGDVLNVNGSSQCRGKGTKKWRRRPQMCTLKKTTQEVEDAGKKRK